MKITLRPEWRLRPLSSFVGILDLKTGVTVVLLFALLNKVAGVYGLISLLTGAGASAAQLSLYIYSTIALVALAWGLQAISQEDPKHTLYFAHLFFADHVLSTAWLVFFAVFWWIYTPHDGRRQFNSAAQEELSKLGGISQNMTEEQRTAAAMALWKDEQGLATIIIVLGWLAKFYFAAVLYSYATHLRKGSYRSLPLSRSTAASSASATFGPSTSALGDDDEDDAVEDFYRLPVRAPLPPHPGAQNPTPGGSSISSFADFVSAPSPSNGRTRKGRTSKSNLSVSVSARDIKQREGSSGGSSPTGVDGAEVLFDEREESASAR